MRLIRLRECFKDLAVFADCDYEKMLAATAEGLPLKKVATAEEVAEVLVWFLLGASVVTGETLIVDSGLHLGPFPPYASGEGM